MDQVTGQANGVGLNVRDGEPARTALVTGASRGIGRGIAIELARQGFAITATSRQQDHLDPLVDVLLDAGAASVNSVALDLSSSESADELVSVHRSRFDSLDVLVLCGGMAVAGSVADMPSHRTDTMLKVNFTSAFGVIQAALPLLRQAAARRPAVGARVIGIGSSTGLYAKATLAAYGASKAALTSLIESVNLEESPNGVLATTIAPGYVSTQMSDWLADRIAPDEMIAVDDVVAVVRMLLQLRRQTCIPQVVMTRSGTSGYEP